MSGGRGPLVPWSQPEIRPPSEAEDPELHRVARAIKEQDPDGALVGEVLRATIDQLLDGQHTGRYDWATLRKTEKTHMGTLVEINLHRAFDFEDGEAMDYRIAGVEVDCKFSQSLGGWELPPEAEGHLCLVVWANDYASRWEMGLVRAADGVLGPSRNRDLKRRLSRAGQATVLWLYSHPKLPENLLLQLDDETRTAILAPNSGQKRINELFRRVQERIVRRATVFTVARQDDSMKRARDARLPRHLGREGFLVLGHQEQDPLVAKALELDVPRKGEFISVRVHPYSSGDAVRGGVAKIGSLLWRRANDGDPLVVAPVLSRAGRNVQ